MKRAAILSALLISTALAAGVVEAPVGFDDQTNGMVDQATHDANRNAFDEVETIKDGLGPVYNAQSCRECHQNLVSGGGSQVSELRVGHTMRGRFQTPVVRINDGKDTITGRTLINDRAICPQAQERVPAGNPIRTFRMSLNLLGDGFIEAVPDATLEALARKNGGLALKVPILEAPGQGAIGRFGWKAQHASLLSFSADAYLNEMGITNRLQPDEVTTVCQPTNVPQPNDQANDIEKFAMFMRSTKAPPRDEIQAATPDAKRGEQLFKRIGCERCHVATMRTASAGTKINGGTFTIPDALGDKVFHPYSDFLLHDVGTGGGIGIAVVEHFGAQAGYMPRAAVDQTPNRLRTPPLWGVRLRTRLMHDGANAMFFDAIRRHAGEARGEARRFNRLPDYEQNALIAFLRSL
jgi:CxxC motif-containing protein (DUF1111 family)